MKLYNTMNKGVEEFKPRDDKKVSPFLTLVVKKCSQSIINTCFFINFVLA